MFEILISIMGWAGAAIMLYAYYSVSLNKMDGTSMKFQVLNIVSALLIFFNSAYYGALPSAAINAAWIGIAFLSINQYKKLEAGKA